MFGMCPQRIRCMADTHCQPTLILTFTLIRAYSVMDKAIGLTECEGYLYISPLSFNSHANDFSDDEDGMASIMSKSCDAGDDNETMFQFDNYDIDDVPSKNANSPLSKMQMGVHRIHACVTAACCSGALTGSS